jgi:hypothetical protein
VSADLVQIVAAASAFAPTGKPWLMEQRHVPLDEVIRPGRYEQRVTDQLVRGEAAVLIGVSGVGKTSLAVWVSNQLPLEFVSLRLLVSAMDDPTDVGEVMKLALGTILDAIQLDADEREEVHIARADSRTASRAPVGVTGGKLGGGPIPVEVNVEVGSLRQEFREDRLNGEYVQALNQVLAILADKGIRVVFSMDDAEAIAGGQAEVVEGLLGGVARIFVEEIDASFLLAIQPHLVEESAAYARLAPSMLVLAMPMLGERAGDALERILTRCLEVAEIACRLDNVFSPDALTGLVQFYDDMGGRPAQDTECSELRDRRRGNHERGAGHRRARSRRGIAIAVAKRRRSVDWPDETYSLFRLVTQVSRPLPDWQDGIHARRPLTQEACGSQEVRPERETSSKANHS